MAQVNGLLDLVQSASNTAADTVAGPVDLISWALRKAGVPVPDDAVGGSEWMKKKGLKKDVQQSPASLAGETLGLISPIAAAAKAPQIAAGLIKAAENAAAPRTLNPEKGAIVWHGSPHKFDRFDSSKIGTGEGAQAYGHGIYTAEARDVAQGYRDALSKNVTVDGAKLSTIPSDGPMAEAHNMVVRNIQNGMAPDAAISAAQKYWADAANEMRSFAKSNPELADRIQKEALSRMRVAEAAATLKPQSFYRDPGHLYKVDLPDPLIARMLDWDKPLSQQAPEVRQKVFGDIGSAISMTQEALSKASSRRASTTTQELEKLLREQSRLQNLSGQSFYQQLSRGEASGAADAATQLRALGIPGIRYLDGGSRGVGQGTSNFVIFPGEESALRILERNGVPLGLLD